MILFFLFHNLNLELCVLLFSFWVENLVIFIVFVPMTLISMICPFFYNPTSILILIKAFASSLLATISQAIVACSQIVIGAHLPLSHFCQMTIMHPPHPCHMTKWMPYHQDYRPLHEK
jgi:hypothetical protein